MKILAVCNHGNVRSQCMSKELRNRGHEAFAIGVDSTKFTDETMKVLCEWAELILDFSDGNLSGHRIPVLDRYEAKIIRQDIGVDIWRIPSHPELKEIMRNIINELELEQ